MSKAFVLNALRWARWGLLVTLRQPLIWIAVAAAWGSDSLGRHARDLHP